jgi:hypothetical protein
MKLLIFILFISSHCFARTYINCGSTRSPVEITIQLENLKVGNIIISTNKIKFFLNLKANRVDASKIEYKAKRKSSLYSITFNKRIIKRSTDYFIADLYIETPLKTFREQLNCYSKIFN